MQFQLLCVHLCKAPESICIDLRAILIHCIILITCIHIICIYTVYVMSIAWSIYLKIITMVIFFG